MTVQSPNTFPNTRTTKRLPIAPIAIISVVALLIIGLGIALFEVNQPPLDHGAAPDIALVTFDNQPFKLSANQGKIVLLNFWASWCNTCPGEAPILNKLWNDYRAKGVVFMGIGHLDNRADALAFMARYEMQYPTAPDDGNHVSDAYRVNQVPETYLIDQHGALAFVLHGPVTADFDTELRTRLDKLLASQTNQG